MGKFLKKAAAVAAPIVGNLIAPGIGGIIGGALGGGISGGGLKGIAGGALGGAALGYGGSLGSALSGGALSKAASSALGSGLLGAASGGVLGGGKGALLGGATGALGGYAKEGGLGNAAGGALQGPTQTGAPLNETYGGSGVLGAITKAVPGLSASGGGTSSYGSTGLSGSYGNLVTPLLSAGIGAYSNDKTEDALLDQQKKNSDLYSPFLTSSFAPGDLTQDPGYQFQLEEGNKALDRQQSAKGNYFSGEALQAAQDYGQGLAGQTYQDAYNRYLGQQKQRLDAAQGIAGVNDNIGNIEANSITNTGNLLTGSGAALLGGTGISNTGSTLGGGGIASLIAGLTPQQLAQLKAQLGA